MLHDRNLNCLWDWQSNTIGRVFCSQPKNVYTSSHVLSHQFKIATCTCSHEGHVTVEFHSVAKINPSNTFQNDAKYPSPFYISHTSIGHIVWEKSNNARKVIHSSNTSTISWEESRIPSHYLQKYGKPRIASSGKRYCRGFAFSSSRSLCVLDRGKKSSFVSKTKSWPISPTYHVPLKGTEGHSSDNPNHRKWRILHNFESSFRVCALSWWETSTSDLVFAAVKNETSTSSFKIFCWSRDR